MWISLRRARPTSTRVRALTGPDFGEVPVAAPPGGLTSLRALASSLANLATAVDGADAEPTPDAEAAIPKVAQAVQATLAAWATLEQRRSP
jgi:hypothetical protein